jgi:hypothetical protein
MGSVTQGFALRLHPGLNSYAASRLGGSGTPWFRVMLQALAVSEQSVLAAQRGPGKLTLLADKATKPRITSIRIDPPPRSQTATPL